MRKLICMIWPRIYDWFPPRRRGRVKTTASEYELLAAIRSSSYLTEVLIHSALQGIEKIPFIRMDYLIEASLYLHFLEREMGVICTIEEGEA